MIASLYHRDPSKTRSAEIANWGFSAYSAWPESMLHFPIRPLPNRRMDRRRRAHTVSGTFARYLSSAYEVSRVEMGNHSTDCAQYYIGVDGGGTTCRARIENAEGHLLGQGIAGPA